MEITSTTQTTYTNATYNSKDKTSTKNTSFDIASIKDKNPKEITFEEYKNLTKDDIDELFPIDTMQKENELAKKLQNKAFGTTDDTLNKILFEKELNKSESEAENIALTVVDRMFEMIQKIRLYGQRMQEANQYMKENGIPFSSANLQTIYDKIVNDQKDQLEDIEFSVQQKSQITPEMLFESFDLMEQNYNNNIEYYQESKTPFYLYANEIFNYYKTIKDEYNQKVKEKEALLASYTRSSKPQALEENQTNDN